MPPFNGGISVNYPHGKNGLDGKPRKKPAKYLMVKAGPQRGRYVHDLIMEAILGRPLEKDETVEHKDGDGLNVGWNAEGEFNLIVVTKEFNTRLRHIREQRAKAKEVGQELMPWTGQF